MIIVKGGYERVDFWALDFRLIEQLRRLNDTLVPNGNICVHCGVEGLHSQTGFHPKGMAVDIHFELEEMVLQTEVMLFSLIKRWNGGIGIYTYWSSPGFHLDVGPVRTWWKKDDSSFVYTLADYVKKKGLNEYYEKIV